jgi:hypothetical protein
MQPLKPDQKREILQDNAEADAADLEEYERLLSQRFRTDPDQPQPQADAATADADQAIEQRLRELQKRLFRRKP